ncbi:chromate transporter [Bacteroidia bacterium]|nr:chromate transporter [Bacteroidia bacterium]
MIYLQLFWTYFKIGLFGFGGGYALLSLIQHEVIEKYQWLSLSEFTDIVAISQMTPGPIGINSATYIGYTVTGNVFGAITATFAVSLPSFIIVLIIAKTYQKFRSNPYIENAFKGLRPATVGLIASAALLLMTPANFIDYKSFILFGIAFLLLWFKKIHPILLIVLAGVSGLVLY